MKQTNEDEGDRAYGGNKANPKQVKPSSESPVLFPAGCIVPRTHVRYVGFTESKSRSSHPLFHDANRMPENCQRVSGEKKLR